MMTNSELQDAITMANAMLKATGQDSRTYAPLLEHLNALLKRQQQRAEQALKWPSRFTEPPKIHASDCAMHNAPAYPAGECDCGALGPNGLVTGPL